MSDELVKRLRIGIHKSVDEQALREEAADHIEQLEAALRALIASCDAGRRVEKFGVSGMTVQTNIQSAWIHNVEAWAVEEARAALAGEKKDE